MREVGRVGPAPYRQEHFEVTVFLLQQIELFHAAVNVVTLIAPRIIRVVLKADL